VFLSFHSSTFFQVEPFQSIVRFNAMQWYYIDIEGAQHGPVLSKMLVHKLKEGEIDGLSLVYGGDVLVWTKVSEVDVLKVPLNGYFISTLTNSPSRILTMALLVQHEMVKIAEEEENMRLAFLNTQNDSADMQKQVFIDDHDPRQAYALAFPDAVKANQSKEDEAEVTDSKTYIADNGQRYVWDEEENDWVEAEDDEASVEGSGTQAVGSKRKQAKDAEEGDDSGDEEGGGKGAGGGAAENGVAAAADAASKPKKKRSKKKAKKGPNNWVYVTGLPANVTAQEIKDHFSKVRF
jgi:hypothetical protein